MIIISNIPQFHWPLTDLLFLLLSNKRRHTTFAIAPRRLFIRLSNIQLVLFASTVNRKKKFKRNWEKKNKIRFFLLDGNFLWKRTYSANAILFSSFCREVFSQTKKKEKCLKKMKLQQRTFPPVIFERIQFNFVQVKFSIVFFILSTFLNSISNKTKFRLFFHYSVYKNMVHTPVCNERIV